MDLQNEQMTIFFLQTHGFRSCIKMHQLIFIHIFFSLHDLSRQASQTQTLDLSFYWNNAKTIRCMTLPVLLNKPSANYTKSLAVLLLINN